MSGRGWTGDKHTSLKMVANPPFHHTVTTTVHQLKEELVINLHPTILIQ